MLRITLEIVPGGREERKQPLTVCEIANVGGNGLADYSVELGDEIGDMRTADIKRYSKR